MLVMKRRTYVLAPQGAHIGGPPETWRCSSYCNWTPSEAARMLFCESHAARESFRLWRDATWAVVAGTLVAESSVIDPSQFAW